MTEELYTFSPSTHTVPCSPFLTKSKHSPAPHVPDIDSTSNRFSSSHFDNRHIVPSPLIHNSQYAQSDAQLQCLPSTPHNSSKATATRRKIDTETPFEQVVPSCSPFATFDEKPSAAQNPRNHATPNDEKLSRRQNRSLLSKRSPISKEVNFFNDEEIFG